MIEIENVDVYSLRIPLKEVFKTSRTEQKAGLFVVVKIDSGSTSGFGEADPRPYLTGETVSSVVSALKEYIIPAIRGFNVFDMEGINSAVEQAIELNPTAKSSINLAIFDLLGKITGLPVYALLGGRKCTKIPVNAWSGITQDPSEAVQIIESQLEEGFQHAAKIKVGRNPIQDVDVINRVAEVLPSHMDLLIDANQAWTPGIALNILRQVETDVRVIVEQPVYWRDFEGMRRLTSLLSNDVMADESVWSSRDAYLLGMLRAATMINIKLLKCGGLHEARKLVGVSEAAGMKCMIGSTLQTSISAAAQAHFAAAFPWISYADIAIPERFLAADIADGLSFQQGNAILTERPGLGLEVNEDMIKGYALEK